MRISDWSSDVCSSDLAVVIRDERRTLHLAADPLALQRLTELAQIDVDQIGGPPVNRCLIAPLPLARASDFRFEIAGGKGRAITDLNRFEITIKKRSEEHTSELKALSRISYDVFRLKKKNKTKT